MTSQPSEQNHTQHQLFQLDFHAKTSQSQGHSKASQRLQGLVSSMNSSEPYAWYDQNTSSWKTCQLSLLTEWTSFSLNFTRQGTMQNGAVFQAALLELATSGIVGGLLPTPLNSDPDRKAKFKQGGTPLRAAIDREMLPTPTTMDHLNQRSPEALKKQMEGARKGRTSLSNLREAVNPKTQEIFNSLLPTPRASDMEGGIIKDAKFKNGSFYRENKKGEKFGIKLRDAVTLLPTPRSRDWKGKTRPDYKERGYGATLPDVADQLPTPRAAIGMGMKLSENMADLEHKKYLETEIAAKVHKHGDVQNTDSTQTGNNMYLNPQFVEEMMGYPLNWTLNKEFKDLKC